MISLQLTIGDKQLWAPKSVHHQVQMSGSYLKQEGFGREAWGLHSPVSYSVSESNHGIIAVELLELLQKMRDAALALVCWLKKWASAWALEDPQSTATWWRVYCTFPSWCLVIKLIYGLVWHIWRIGLLNSWELTSHPTNTEIKRTFNFSLLSLSQKNCWSSLKLNLCWNNTYAGFF